ncbi:MAG: hypothetical protein ABIR70_12810 [Bryobacteraceae bacterium]
MTLTLACACIAAGRDRIGAVEYFGTQGLDMAKIRSETPVHVGDPFSETLQATVRGALATTDVAGVCCDENGDGLIFIGLSGTSTKPFTFNPNPNGQFHAPPEITKLSARLDKAMVAAVQKGGTAAQEDDSKGYALINDPAARSIQLEIREWVLQHEAQVKLVLEQSSFASDRRIASEALGYARQSPEQIAALVHASRDADGGVRNNATRALGVLVRSNASLAAAIEPETFIEMLGSGIWTDRNKAAGLLVEMTSQRPAALLATLRTKSLPQLIEMAAWRKLGHAYYARIILGRIVGIPEPELQKLAAEQPEAILEAASKLAN